MEQGSPDFLQTSVREMLARQASAEPVSIHPLSGGKNNRVFRVELGRDQFLLKQYFSHPGDTRKRQENEWQFYQLAMARGVADIPRALAQDPKAGLSLFEFIEGDAVSTEHELEDHTEAAIAFFRALNKEPLTEQMLADASEARFSVSGHIESVAGRVLRLGEIDITDAVDENAITFWREQLVPAWEGLRERVLRFCDREKVNVEVELPFAYRCISPSDFGFHNAKKSKQGDLYFYDFEYAGIDDPARTIADFYCQVEIPAPKSTLAAFVSAVANLYAGDEQFRKRVALLLPLYHIKWSCMILNNFLPTGQARRKFAEQKAHEFTPASVA